MASIFTLLPSVGQSIDKLIQNRNDILALEVLLRPFIMGTKMANRKIPSVIDFYKMGYQLSKLVSDFGWITRNADKGNILIGTILRGIAAKDQWKQLGTAADIFLKDPYRYMAMNAYSMYLATQEKAPIIPQVASSSTPIVSLSSSGTTSVTVNDSSVGRRKRKGGIQKPRTDADKQTPDQVLNLTNPNVGDLNDLLGSTEQSTQ